MGLVSNFLPSSNRTLMLLSWLKKCHGFLVVICGDVRHLLLLLGRDVSSCIEDDADGKR